MRRISFIIRRLELANLFVIHVVFVKKKNMVCERFYPYGIKSRTFRRCPGLFGPGSFRSGQFGLSHFDQFFVVSALIGGSFRPDF